MAQLAFAAAGAVILGPAGLALTSAATGFAIGSFAYAATRTQTVHGPRLNPADLRAPKLQYGAKWPRLYGRQRLSPIVLWRSDLTEHAEESEQGKGGGTTVVGYSYTADVLVGIADGYYPDGAILRVWIDGKLVAVYLSEASAETIAASAATDAYDELRTYLGGPTQLPDPDYEAAVGTERAIAWRRRFTVLFRGLKHNGKQMPLIEVEACSDAVPDEYGLLNNFDSATGGVIPSLIGPDLALQQSSTVSGGSVDIPANGGITTTAVAGQAGTSWRLEVKARPRQFSGPVLSIHSSQGWHVTLDTNYLNRLTVGVYTAGNASFTNDIQQSASTGDSPPDHERAQEQACRAVAAAATAANQGNPSPSNPFAVDVDYAYVSSSANSCMLLRTATQCVDAQCSGLTTSTTGPFNSGMVFNQTGEQHYDYIPRFRHAGRTEDFPTIAELLDLQAITAPHSRNEPDTDHYYAAQFDVNIGTLSFYLDGQRFASFDVGVDAFAGANFNNVRVGPLTQYGVFDGLVYFVAFNPRLAADELYGASYAPVDPVPPWSNVYGPQQVNLEDVVRAEHLRANGGVAAEFDASDLAGIPITGIACVGSARQNIEALMETRHFTAVCSDKVYYRLLGGPSRATIPFAHTGVGVDEATDTPFTGLTRHNDSEVAAQVKLTYQNFSADYDAGVQEADRLIGVANKIDVMQAQETLTGALAQGVAETHAHLGRLALTRGSVTLDDRYAKLEPADSFTLTDPDGTTYFVFCEETQYADGVYEHKVRLDDAALIRRSGVATSSYTPNIVVVPAGEAEMVLLDTPILRDADDSPGHYVAARNSGERAGASIQRSIDDATYEQVAAVRENAILGTCVTTLPNFAGGNLFDETSTLRVNVGTATLSSYSRDAVLDQGAGACAVGDPDAARWEIVQYRNAALVSSNPNVYDLSGFLRGRRGSEFFIGNHTAGERFVALPSAGTGIRRVDDELADWNAQRFFKAVVWGRSFGTAEAETFTNTEVGLKPFAPVDLRLDLDNPSAPVVTWNRRSRLSADTVTGIVSLGEKTEAYAIDWFDDADELLATFATSEPRVELSSLVNATPLEISAQGVRLVGTELFGWLAYMPTGSSGGNSGLGSLNRFNASTGLSTGAEFVGSNVRIEQMVNDSATLWVAVTSGAGTSNLFRYTTAAWGSGPQATYIGTLAADVQGVAYDGSAVWISETYSNRIRKLNATTLAVVTSYSVTAPGKMQFASGVLWVYSAGVGILKIDPADGSVDLTLPMAGPQDFAVTANAVFAVFGDRVETYDHAGTLLSTEPANSGGNVYRSYIAVGTSYVVVGDTSNDELLFFDHAGALVRRAAVDDLIVIAGANGATFYTNEGLRPPTPRAYTLNVGTPQGYVRVYQVSDAVGRGYPAELQL